MGDWIAISSFQLSLLTQFQRHPITLCGIAIFAPTIVLAEMPLDLYHGNNGAGGIGCA